MGRSKRTLRSPERYHDRVAPLYDAMYEGDAYWKLQRELTWAHLKPHLPREPGAYILDAGGGTGTWALRLARAGYQVTLADTSRGMLDAARKKLQRAAEGVRVGLLRADISRLDQIRDGVYSLAIALGDPISFCDDPKAAVRNLARVLRPGAVCVASVDGRYGSMGHFIDEDLDQLEGFLRTGRTEWLAKRTEERFPVHTFTPDGLRRLFRQGGFEVLSVIGKTVLPVRRMRERLEDRATYVQILRLEQRLQREECLLGQAAHLEIAARLPPEQETSQPA